MRIPVTFFCLLISSIISYAQPEMSFNQKSVYFQKIKDLSKANLKAEYRFKNTGNKPLRIFYIVSDNRDDEYIFPEIIQPYDSGVIIVYPKIKAHLGSFSKSVKVYTNLGIDRYEYLSYSGTSLDSSGPVIEFETTEVVFDSLIEGVHATAEYQFKNTGNQPLLITGVNSSCGCLTPSWTKEPVMPGKTGVIKGTYNSSGRPGRFQKSMTVTSNSIVKNVQILTIKGDVRIGPVSVTFNPVAGGVLPFKQKAVTKVISGQEVDTLWCDFGDITTGEVYECLFGFSSGPYGFNANFSNYSQEASFFVNLKFSTGDDITDFPPARFSRTDSGDGILKWDFSKSSSGSGSHNKGYMGIRIQNHSGASGAYIKCMDISSNANKKAVLIIKANLVSDDKIKLLEVINSYDTELYYYENNQLCRYEKKYMYADSKDRYYIHKGRTYRWEFVDKNGKVSRYSEVKKIN